jgi:hypothetical protein
MKRILFLIGVVLALASCTEEPNTFVPYRSEQMVGDWHVIQDNRTGYDTIAQSYDISIIQNPITPANIIIYNFANLGAGNAVNVSVGYDGSMHILPSDTAFGHGHGYLFSEPVEVVSRINDNNNWFELQYIMKSTEDSALVWNGWLFVEKY